MPMDTAEEAVRRARQEWERRYLTVRLVARHLDVSASELGRAIGLAQSLMSERFNGKKVIEPWELEGMAAYLGVPVHILMMEPGEAIKWLSDHPQRGKAQGGNGHRRKPCYSTTTLVPVLELQSA